MAENDVNVGQHKNYYNHSVAEVPDNIIRDALADALARIARWAARKRSCGSWHEPSCYLAGNKRANMTRRKKPMQICLFWTQCRMKATISH